MTWYSYPLWICASIEIDLAVVSILKKLVKHIIADEVPKICACAPALKPLVHKPILRMSSRISSKISSVLRSRGTNSQTSSDKTSSAKSANRNAIRFARSDEEFGMLHQSRQSDKSTIHIACIPADCPDSGDRGSGLNPWSRRHSGHLPPLQIIKRQSLEQEISYLDPHDPHNPSTTTPARSETFDF